MDILYKTSKEQRIRLYEIADSMRQHGLDAGFVENGVELAEIYEGAFDLFCLWADETDENEKNYIVCDLETEIAEFQKGETL